MGQYFSGYFQYILFLHRWIDEACIFSLTFGYIRMYLVSVTFISVFITILLFWGFLVNWSWFIHVFSIISFFSKYMLMILFHIIIATTTEWMRMWIKCMQSMFMKIMIITKYQLFNYRPQFFFFLRQSSFNIQFKIWFVKSLLDNELHCNM